MATKFKATSRGLLFIFTVVLLAMFMIVVLQMGVSDFSFSNAFTSESYESSEDAMGDLYLYADKLGELGNYYISEEHIKSGELVDYSYHKLDSDTRKLLLDFNNSSKNGKFEDAYDVSEVSDEAILEFVQTYPEQVANLKNTSILKDLNRFKQIKEDLEQAEGLLYYYKGAHVSYSNSEDSLDSFLNKQAYYVFDQSGENYSAPFGYYQHGNLYVESDILYVAFTDEYIEAMSIDWLDNNSELQVYVVLVVILVLLYVIGIMILLIGVSKDDKWILSGLYLEFIFMVNGGLFGLSSILIAVYDDVPPVEMFAIFSVTASLIANYTLLQLVKQYKEHRLRHSIVYKLCAWFIRKLVIIIASLPFVIRMVPNPWNAHDFKKAFLYLDHIKKGDFNYNVDVKSSGLYADLIKSLDSVKDGMEVAVVNELKSERMKSELISNVSHDIRTPLTSITTYLDLLNNEDDKIKQKEYLGVLNHKVARLNMLVEDLFDAAKITSGNIPIELESVDLKQLLQQVIGEYYDQFEDRGLEIIETIDPVLVSADRKSLWRVIDNLIGNIVKYALENSRVYIEAIQLEDTVKIIFKNISHDALNMHAEELKLRFKRGDVARTTNGSGLGLAIAEDLIKLQGGQLDLIIDGDLFKAVVTLNHE